MQTKCAVILADGNASRLKYVSRWLPKPLMQLGSKPLLEHVILGLQQAGIERFVIVVGYGRNAIRSWVENRRFPGAQIELVENRNYMRSNGISLLKARELVREPFVAVLADHLFEPATAVNLVSQPLDNQAAIVAVDFKLQSIVDMNDTTEVACQEKQVIDVGKNLAQYNAVDTGMYLCTPAVFTALEEAMVNGDCSLANGMRVLAANHKLLAFDIGEGVWQHVNTAEGLQNATRVLTRCHRKLHPASAPATVHTQR